MKLISAKRNDNGKLLICSNGVFDPHFLKITEIDKNEQIVCFSYNFYEYGNPLDLPFEASDAQFCARITPNNIHLSLITTPEYDFDSEYEKYVNEIGDIEFDVRLDKDEKSKLLSAILFHILKDCTA